jgi:hypothetical protein
MSDGELRSIFRSYLPRVAWSTIETAAVEPGVADLNGCLGTEFWVECKLTYAWAVEVKPAQVAWHKLRDFKGGRTFFAVRRRNGSSDELYVIKGRYADVLRISGVRACPALLCTKHGPARWDWERVLAILTGG